MEYGKIIATGWSQAWKHKTLWIFGFLISGGNGLNILNYSEDLDKIGLSQGDLYQTRQFIVEHMYLIVLLGLMAFVAFLIWIVLNKIAIGGMISAAGQMKRGETYSFTRSFGEGASNFWKLLGIGILMFIILAAFIIFLGLIGVAGFLIHVALGILALVVILPILIVGIYIVTITVAMAERFIVLEKRPVFDSISDGYSLWKSNLGPSLIYSLIYLGLSIAIGLGIMVIVLFTVIPFVAVGFVNLLMAILIGIPVILLILLVVEGYTGSAMHLMTTEFFFRLKEMQKPSGPTVEPGSGYSPPPPPPQPQA